ncbi:MAG: PspA/IM30 family protein, partial [Bdellovibrionales bacterium]|nr:PspA/IM30 family protein [Bdellovibrionales bacterium]
VEKDGQQLKTRIRELNESAVTWQERAKESKEKDKEKAIECLRRKKRAERELSALEVQLAEHSKTEVLLKKELSAVEGKLVELKRQRNIMRTRESNALARTTCGTREVDLVTEIADVFDRWEAKVTEYEAIADPSVTDFDDLEDQFATEEEHRELEAELQSLS